MKRYILLLAVLGVLAQGYAQDATYEIKNLAINTKNSDFGATYYDGNRVVFSSPRAEGNFVKRIWKPNEQPYLDFYESTIGGAGDELTDKVPFSKEINTKLHEGTLAFTKDYQTVYFTRDNYLDGKVGKSDAEGKIVLKLYKATVTNGKWGNIVELPFNSHDYSVGHPSLSKDDKQLYFVSNMPGSMGATDVFVVDILGDNEYSTPRNLGPTINTVGKEMFPFIDEDDVLYFSSNGRADCLGGLDIYYSEKQDDNTYTIPKNLGSSINSVSDDFSFVKKKGADKGYFASNRYGGKGDDDIYAFTRTPMPKKCESIVKGLTKEKGTGVIVPNATVNIYDATGKIVHQTTSNTQGAFSYSSTCNKNFKVEALKGNYTKAVENVTTSLGAVELAMSLTKEVVQPAILQEQDVSYDTSGRLLIDIEDIYYNLNKSNIRPSEQPKMNRLVELMNKYPSIQVEIGSHTDCRGTASYNMRLSDRRAQAAMRYVVSRGISSSRIQGRGYGESNPINGCDCRYKCTEEEYQQNRRTEFVITNQ
ncbi:OmpA family protein [Tenacibaculum holothuriorum]|uniref:OmpA family protein n=1 Tax=Tenacibaculum holothuriorum TaxID=1635173 RepID=UPI000A32008B|nr:OmpA family protein [Tenacibaculum holothuriorum]